MGWDEKPGGGGVQPGRARRRGWGPSTVRPKSVRVIHVYDQKKTCSTNEDLVANPMDMRTYMRQLKCLQVSAARAFEAKEGRVDSKAGLAHPAQSWSPVAETVAETDLPKISSTSRAGMRKRLRSDEKMVATHL